MTVLELLMIGILLITTIGAYALVLRRLRRKSPSPSRPRISGPVPKKRSSKAPQKTTKGARRKASKAKVRKPRPACADRIEYLMTLPKNATVPDECLECSNIVSCLNRARTKNQGERAATPTGGQAKSRRIRKRHPQLAAST